MIAFAANSVLCRLALHDTAIDPGSFTAIRLLSGAVLLALVVRFTRRAERAPRTSSDWLTAAVLVLYGFTFSLAYLLLSAGTGALILFGAAQITMITAGYRAGERFTPLAWCGFAAAVGGVAWLVSPGVTAPSPVGAALMGVAGLAWGVYSLRGRGVRDPLRATASNFAHSLPFAAVVGVLLLSERLNLRLALCSLAVLGGIAVVLSQRGARAGA
jgi:drug/metabolite transporter (DMT)-like permease